MKRRNFSALVGSAAMWTSATRAQQKAMPVIGYLDTLARGGPAAEPFLAAFRQGLSEGGYIEGENVAGEYRSAESRPDRLASLADELVGRNVNVIVTTGVPAARAAKSATSTIPVVFIGAG